MGGKSKSSLYMQRLTKLTGSATPMVEMWSLGGEEEDCRPLVVGTSERSWLSGKNHIITHPFWIRMHEQKFFTSASKKSHWKSVNRLYVFADTYFQHEEMIMMPRFPS